MYFEYPSLLDPPIARAAYSDRTAWLMAGMSALAYTKFEVDKVELIKGLQEAGFELVDTFNSGGTQAFLARRSKDKMAVLAFRGTESNDPSDIKADLDANFYNDQNGVKIDDGFWKAFSLIKDPLAEKVKTVNDCALYITGHSLGGALALIATRAFNSDNLAACYTFGSPKVGNSEYGDEIKPPIYRVVNAFDAVPLLPPTYLFEILKYLFTKLKLEKLTNFFQKYIGYSHHGDMRFLTLCKSDFSDLRLIQNYDDIIRTIRCIKASWVDKQIGVKCHSLDEYRVKLGQYALKRLNER